MSLVAKKTVGGDRFWNIYKNLWKIWTTEKSVENLEIFFGIKVGEVINNQKNFLGLILSLMWSIFRKICRKSGDFLGAIF